MFKRLFTAALVFGAAAIGPPADAQQISCMPRPVLISSLEHQHAEVLTGGGLQNTKQLIEVWTSPKTGSFTIFITHANGVSCIVATGHNWHSTNASAPDGRAS